MLAFVIYPSAPPDGGQSSRRGLSSKAMSYHNVVVGLSGLVGFGLVHLLDDSAGLHLRHGVWSMFQSLGMNHPRHTPILKSSGNGVGGGNCAGVHLDSDQRHAGAGEIDGTRLSNSFRPDRAGVGQRRKLRDEAGESGQQAEAHDHRGGLGPGRRRGRGDAGRAGLQREVLLLPGFARGARTRSPRRAASTPRRTIRTTATASTGCSTTRSRAAISARAKRTSTAWRRSASTSSTSAWRRACRSRANTAACSTNRSFGGAQVSRTFYARGQTGQQLLLGAYQALERQVQAGSVTMYPAHRDARPDRDRRPGARHRHARHGHRRDRVAPGRCRGARHRRLRQRLLPVHQRQGLERHRDLARVQARRAVRQSVLHADPPHLHSGVRRVPIEADADERVAAQRRAHLGAEEEGRQAAARTRSRKTSATTTSSGGIRASATWCRATSPRATRKRFATRGAASAEAGLGVYLDFADAIKRLGREAIRERYGNLFEMYERITDEDPYKVPMRIYPAVHYTMGGLWVDYNLMSTIPGLFVIGEANFSDHGANRLGASALMQGSGRRLFHPAVHDRRLPRARTSWRRSNESHAGGSQCRRRACSETISKLLSIKGKRTVDSFHRELGKIDVGVLRHGAQRGGPRRRRSSRSASCARNIWQNVNVSGQRRGSESEPREGRPRRRLPRAGRADVPRRAGPRGILRRPLPRGVPDARRRSAARRRAIRVRRRVGIRGHGQPSGAASRSRSSSSTCTRARGATSKCDSRCTIWRQKSRKRHGQVRQLRCERRQPGHVVPRDAGRGERSADREGRRADRVRPRLPRRHLRHRAAS